MQLSGLPIELQNEVLQKLNGVSLARAECVCKTWHELLSREIYNKIWRQVCLGEIDQNVLVEVTGIENILVSHINAGKRFPSTTHVWKAIYKRWYISRKVGKWPLIKREVQAHNVNVVICDINICGNVVYSAGINGIIKMWDSWTGTCLNVLYTNHLCPVTTMAVFPASDQPKSLLCGSEDRTISIWDLKTGASMATLTGHNHTVSCLVVYKHFIVSASFDQTIKLWDLHRISQVVCIRTLKGHHSPITNLSVWKMTVLSISCDAIKLWSLESGECLYTIEDSHYIHEYITQGCTLRGRYALVLKSNGELKFCDFFKPGISSSEDEVWCNYQLLKYSTTGCSRLSCLATYGNLMAVSSEAGFVYIFDYQKDWSEKPPDILCKVKCGDCSISCIRLSSDSEGPVLVAGSSDGAIHLFRWFSPSVD